MGIFYHEEPPNSSFKRCKFLNFSLKEAFSHCRTCGRHISSRKMETESLRSNDYENEQEVIISEIRTRAMEAKAKRINNFKMDNFSWLSSPTRGGLFIMQTPNKINKNSNHNNEQIDDFYSVSSSFSHCSSDGTIKQYLSVNTNLSEMEYLNEIPGNLFVGEFLWGLDDEDIKRRLIIREICQCDGWPFGLCRKALLLPPLPKSPSESWLWRKK